MKKPKFTHKDKQEPKIIRFGCPYCSHKNTFDETVFIARINRIGKRQTRCLHCESNFQIVKIGDDLEVRKMPKEQKPPLIKQTFETLNIPDLSKIKKIRGFTGCLVNYPKFLTT